LAVRPNYSLFEAQSRGKRQLELPWPHDHSRLSM
jgi:hypothetical protein